MPASEGFTIPGEELGRSGRIAERLLPDGPLWTLFDLLPDAAFAMLDSAEQRLEDWLALIRDGYQVALASVREGARALPARDVLYLSDREIGSALNSAISTIFSLEGECTEPALSVSMAAPRAAQQRARGDAVVICADAPPPSIRKALRPLARAF